jgi:hypothetical protein
MVLQRPVELAGVIGNYNPPQNELADNPALRDSYTGLLSLAHN